MTRKNYPTDLTDEQWEQLKTYRPADHPRGPPTKWKMREILNAIIYLVKTGCQWRQLPHDFPPWQTVSYPFRKWDKNQTGVMIHHALHEHGLTPKEVRRPQRQLSTVSRSRRQS